MPPFYLRWSPDSVVLGGYITLYDQGKYEGCEEVQNFIIYYFRNCLLIKLNSKLSLPALSHILQTSIGTSNTLFLYAFLSSKNWECILQLNYDVYRLHAPMSLWILPNAPVQ